MTRVELPRSVEAVREAFEGLSAAVETYRSGTERERPLSTPELLGMDRTEGAWQRYLAYFVDPNGAHGFEYRFLDAFLRACESAGAFDAARLHRNRSRVDVEIEVSTQSDRRPDVLIWDSERWFLLLELKVDAPEGEDQTTDYADAEKLGSLAVTDYPDEASYYGFVAPTIPSSIDPRFTGVRWRTIADEFVEARNELTPSEYPLRSVTQLDDFIDTMQTDTTDLDERTRELAELYFKHRNEIEAADDAVSAVVENQLQHEWVGVLEDPETKPSYWSENWTVLTVGNTYGTFGRHGWRMDSGVRIYFEHRPTEGNFRAGDFELHLSIRADKEDREGGDPREPICERFLALLDETNIDLPDSVTVDRKTSDVTPGHSLAEVYHTYDPGSVEGYYGALERATTDVEGLVTVLDELFPGTSGR